MDNRKELAATVSREAELTASQAEAATAAVLDAIVETVGNGETIVLSGFGTFERRHRAARSGRNPQTGERLEIAATETPAFKPAARFKRAVSNRV